MKDSRIHFLWKERNLSARFRTAVSLHSHTLHSRESLDFISRSTANVPWLSGAIRKQKEKYRKLKGQEVDLRRAWWTPPLSAPHAWRLEKSQIEHGLDRNPLVSITDHDNIDAGLSLSLLEEARSCPISVEWTVPFGPTFFHIGLHNLPPAEAPAIMRELQAITAAPAPEPVRAMLARLHAEPEMLIILNHPLWDENHIGEAAHRRTLHGFLALYREFMHAVELNGLRPWKENLGAAGVAAEISLPVISGGDRHGREPNACLNLTNAATFSEFVDEIRSDGWSDVLFMPQYREPLKLRILRNMCDILEDDPKHSLGWVRWSDRVFYLTDEGAEKSLRELWGRDFPAVVTRFVSLMSIARRFPIALGQSY